MATEVEGLLPSGVVEGGLAEEAGLQGRDVNVEFAGLTNIYDSYALAVVKMGEPIYIVHVCGFRRIGRRVDYLADLRRSPPGVRYAEWEFSAPPGGRA